jgi:hypothetical protein
MIPRLSIKYLRAALNAKDNSFRNITFFIAFTNNILDVSQNVCSFNHLKNFHTVSFDVPQTLLKGQVSLFYSQPMFYQS